MIKKFLIMSLFFNASNSLLYANKTLKETPIAKLFNQKKANSLQQTNTCPVPGTFTFIALDSPMPTTFFPHVRGIAISPDSTIVAGTDFSFGSPPAFNEVVTYSVPANPPSNAPFFTVAGKFTTQLGPSAVTFSNPDGKFLAVANTLSNTVSVYNVNRTTAPGVLTPITGDLSTSSFPTPGSPTDLVYAPNGSFLAVTSPNHVSIFNVNQTTGTLTSIGNFSTQRNPQSVAFSPNGQFLAVANQASNTISVYSVNQVTGTLKPITGNLATSSFSTQSAPAALAYSPNELFLTVANRDSNTLSVYVINRATGAIAPITGNLTTSSFPTEKIPFALDFSAEGNFLVVGSKEKIVPPFTQPVPGIITSFAVNTSTGIPTPVTGDLDTSSVEVGLLGGVKLASTNRFVAVNSSDNLTTRLTFFFNPNLLPVAFPVTALASCGVNLNILPLPSDCGVGISVSSVSQPTNGTAQVAAPDRISYTSNTNFSGFDNFTYTIEDNSGHLSTSTVALTVAAVANPVSATAQCGSPSTINVLNSACGTTSNLRVTAVLPPSNGTATINPDFTAITYTPNANFSGVDTFSFFIADSTNGLTSSNTVTVTVSPVTRDNSVSANCNEAVTFNPLLNDCGTGLNIQEVGTPANGTAVISANNTITYTPKTNFSGTDTFSYIVQDANNNQSSASANVIVAPQAVNDTIETVMNIPIVFSPLTNDCGSNLIVTSAGPANNGVVVLVAPLVFYSPNPNFVGTDSFPYSIQDTQTGITKTATVTVNVLELPIRQGAFVKEDKPITIPVTAILPNEMRIVSVSKPHHGKVTFNNSSITYTPMSNSSDKTDSFSFTLAHGDTAKTVSPNGIMNIFISKGANPKVINTFANTPITIATIGHVQSINNPNHGTAQKLTENSITYMPISNFSGNDQFSYTTAISGKTETITINLNVRPLAARLKAVMKRNVTRAFSVLAKSHGHQLIIKHVQQPQHGTVKIGPRGKRLIYKPSVGFTGADTIRYAIHDAYKKISKGYISITVK